MIKDDRWLILIDQLWMNAWLPLSRLLQCAGTIYKTLCSVQSFNVQQCVQCAATIYKALCSVQLCSVQFKVCTAVCAMCC